MRMRLLKAIVARFVVKMCCNYLFEDVANLSDAEKLLVYNIVQALLNEEYSKLPYLLFDFYATC